MFFLAPLIANFYDDQRLVLVAMVLSSTFLLNGIVTQFRADLNRKMNFRRLTIAEVSAQALALGLGIYLASIGWGYWALVTQQVSQLVLLLTILIIVTPWFPHFWHPKESIRPFLSFGANIVGAQLLNYASRNTDSVVLGATLGAGPVGLYNRAFQLMLLPLNQLNGPSTRVALPVLSRLDGNKPRYDAFILLGQTVMLHLVSGVFALLGAQAYAIIYIALGKSWLESVPVFQILLIAGFFQTAGYAANWVYLSKGLTGANLRFSLIARPIMIVIIVIGGFWGLYGVAGAYAFASALIWPFSLWWVARSSDAPARGLFFNGMRTISAYGFATLVSFLATAFLPDDQLVLRIVVGFVALLGALGLLALLWPAFRRDLKAIAGARSLLRSARKPAGSTSGTDKAADSDTNTTPRDSTAGTTPDTPTPIPGTTPDSIHRHHPRHQGDPVTSTTPTAPTAGPLNITFVVPSLHGGGAEFVARTWMGWLVSRGHTVSVITTSGKPTESHLPDGTTAHTVAGASGQLGKARAVAELLETIKPDVAVALQAHANLVLISAGRLMGKKSPPVIISERNLVSLGLAGASASHLAKVWTAKAIYRFADHVIAISHPVAGELVSGFGVSGKRITVVPNPATAKVKSGVTVQRTPGVEHGVQLVLPCRLVVQKRPERAIHAAQELKRRGIDAEVISFGGGPLEEQTHRRG